MTETRDLIDVNRLPRGWQLIPLCLYFPLGLVLCVIRLFIGINLLVAACILPRGSLIRSYVLRTMSLVLGIVVQEENIEYKNSSAKLIISNHVSILDHLALDLVLPCIMPSMWDLPQFINWCWGYKDFNAKRGRSTLVENIKKHLNECNCSVLIHPEGVITNGSGILKFPSWPFGLARTVNPITLKLYRPPPFSVPATVAGSRWYTDLFWFFFTPFTIFIVRYLPEITKDDEEEEQDTAKEVQETIAASLEIKATSITAADISEYVKRILAPTRQPTIQRNTVINQLEENHELSRMAQQVKEVLPYVPLDVIRTDLLRTRNVDLTITNILEGLVQFVPETSTEQLANFTQADSSLDVCSVVSSDSPQNQPCATASENSNVSFTSAASDFSTAASTFGKTAEERMQSFDERKRQLLEHARRLYLCKHQL